MKRARAMKPSYPSNAPYPPVVDDEILEGLRKRRVSESEDGLMCAIVDDAVACFQKHIFARPSRLKRGPPEGQEIGFETDWIPSQIYRS